MDNNPLYLNNEGYDFEQLEEFLDSKDTEVEDENEWIYNRDHV